MCLERVSGVFKQRKSCELTRVSFPVKVVLRIAVTLQVYSLLLVSWAVGEGNVVVSYVFKEVDLVFIQKQAGSDRVYWSITPALVEESTVLVKRFEIVSVGFRS